MVSSGKRALRRRIGAEGDAILLIPENYRAETCRAEDLVLAG